jgi:Fur family transcriptional regulator, ferric uptake regulator
MDATRKPSTRAEVSVSRAGPIAWSSVRDRLRARGLRWTLQRSRLLDVLERTDGHVTGAELVERCRELDPATTPSTVYRTLDVLEELGLVRHHHGADGREEFHVRPETAHGHIHCGVCGLSWELGADEAAPFVDALRRSRGFEVDLTHVTISGRCPACQAAAASA